MTSSVREATSVASYQILVRNELVLSRENPLEISVEESANGQQPRGDKEFPKMELDRRANDVDHGSPLRIRSVLRTLFKGTEPIHSSTRNPKIESEGAVETFDDLLDAPSKDAELKLENDFGSALSDKFIKIEIDGKNQKEEIIMSEDGGLVGEQLKRLSEEFGSISCQTFRNTDLQTRTEEISREASTHMNLTIPYVDDDKSSSDSSRDIISPAYASDSLPNSLKVSTPCKSFEFTGLNHVAFCCENLERTLEFYCGLLGLKVSPDRPNLPYRGAWLLLGAEGIHIMEVPNPDPVYGRPQHGGWDRHVCLNCNNVENIRRTLDKAGIPYQTSVVPSLFCRDPDGNGLEFIENYPRVTSWSSQ